MDRAASDLIAAIKSNKEAEVSALKKDVVGSSITRLQNLRAMCDPRVWPYADAIVRVGTVVKESQDRPANSAARYNSLVGAVRSAANSANAEINRLMSDPKIIEELEN